MSYMHVAGTSSSQGREGRLALHEGPSAMLGLLSVYAR